MGRKRDQIIPCVLHLLCVQMRGVFWKSSFFYLNEKDEVFERRVEVGFLLQLHDGVKVLVVDVGVDPKQALQNGLGHGHEVPLEGDTLSTRGWERKAALSNTHALRTSELRVFAS